MLNVVIADDEMRICQLIKALVDWEGIGLHLQGTASNGMEAVQLIKEQPVDILVTDIRMPGVDGLELIRQVSDLSPKTKMIIISGYAHFDYARKALSYGVLEYLLKPINKEELNRALRKAKEQIEDERREEGSSFLMWGEDIRRLRALLVTDLLDGSFAATTEEEVEKRYHYAAIDHACSTFCLKVDRDLQGGTGNEVEALMEKVETILAMQLKPIASDSVLLRRGTYLYGIVTHPEADSEALYAHLKESILHIQSLRDLFGNLMGTIGLGNTCVRIEELGASMQNAVRTVEERLAQGTDRVISMQDQKWKNLPEAALIEVFMRDMAEAVELLSQDKIAKAVDQLRLKLDSEENVPAWQLKHFILSAAEAFLLQYNVPEREKIAADFRMISDEARSLNELLEMFAEFLQEQVEPMISSREEESARPIRRAKQYISAHFDEPISLDDVSEAVGLTPTYFSVLFKKETGEGFAHYLLTKRLDAAKEMLRESNRTVADICRAVGYNDVRYFTRTFEKETGVKPSTFRKLYG